MWRDKSVFLPLHQLTAIPETAKDDPQCKLRYAGFHTMQLASGAQPDRKDSCKASSNS